MEFASTYYSMMRLQLPLVILFTLLGACSSSITGHVFLDANGNNQVDAGEKGVENASFKVTRDGGRHTDGRTGVSGSFTVRAQESGKYCIEVDKNSVRGLDAKIKPQLAVVPLMAEPAAPTQSIAVSKAVNDSYGTPTASGPPAEGTVTVSSLSGCVQVNMGNQGLAVPIRPDYSTSIAEIPTPQEIKVAPGEAVALKLVWPNSCRLMGVAIPDVLVSDDPEVGIVADISPKLEFPELVKVDSVSPLRDLTQDALASRVVHLRVRHDASGGKQQYSIHPKVQCPDGASYNLPSQTISLVAKPLVSVSQNLKGTQSLGATVMDEVRIANNGDMAVHDAKLTMSFSNMVTDVTVTGVSGCNNLGQNVSCPLDLALGGKLQLQVSFTLPKTVKEKEEYTISATVKLSNPDSDFEADKIHFWLQP